MKFKLPTFLIMKIFTIFVNKISRLNPLNFYINYAQNFIFITYLVLEILTFLFKLLCNSTVFLPASNLTYYARLLFSICMCLSSELLSLSFLICYHNLQQFCLWKCFTPSSISPVQMSFLPSLSLMVISRC